MRTVIAHPADGSCQIASEKDLDVVLAVLGKRIGRRQATARAKRQPRQVIFLCEIGSHSNDVALQRLRGPDREAADFLGG